MGTIKARLSRGRAAVGAQLSSGRRHRAGRPAARVRALLARGQVTESADRGSGLGLAITRHLAEAHGGSASATSVPEKGSTFRLALPLTDAPVPHP